MQSAFRMFTRLISLSGVTEINPAAVLDVSRRDSSMRYDTATDTLFIFIALMVEDWVYL